MPPGWSQAPQWMAEYGEKLIDCGYPIIPIIPGAKCPGRYRGPQHGWQGYPDWTRHCDRLSKPLELQVWKTWPGCGIGIPCGIVGGLDLDIMDLALVDQLEALARYILGDTPTWRIGRAPKKLLPYRMAKPFAKMPRHPLEWLGHGSQFVAYGIHPDTQEPYRWPAEELHEVTVNRLPVVTEGQVRAFMDRAEKLIPASMRVSRLGPDRSSEFYFAAGGDLRGTYEATAEAVEHIPNDDLPYDDWINIGIAIKGSLGEAGLPIWREWSRSSGKSGKSGRRDTAERTWRGLPNPHSKGFGSLQYYASQNGWSPDPSLIFNADRAEAVASVDVSGLVTKAETLVTGAERQLPPHDPETGEVYEEPSGRDGPAANGQSAHEPEPETTGQREDNGEATPGQRPDNGEAGAAENQDIRGMPVAEAILNPGGLLQELTEWMTATAIYPHPILNLAAALSTLGAAAGRRYGGPTDLRTNIYCIAIADSGAGKEHPIGAINSLLMQADMAEYLTGEEVSSGAAIESTIARHPVGLFKIDELGKFMASVTNKNATTHHRSDVLVRLTKLTGQANRFVLGTEYANKKERERVDFWEPCACIFGATLPRLFWEALSHSNLEDGSIPRMLFFQTPVNVLKAKKQESFVSEPPPAHLINGLRRVVAQQGADSDFGFKAAKAMAQDPKNKASLIRVPYADDTGPLIDEIDERQFTARLANEGTEFSAVWARWAEHVGRVALIHAISRDPIAPVITNDGLRWAMLVVDHCIGTLTGAVDRHVSDTAAEADEKKLLANLRRHNGAWVSGKELNLAWKFLSHRDRRPMTRELESAGLVEISVKKPGPKGGAPAWFVRCLSQA